MKNPQLDLGSLKPAAIPYTQILIYRVYTSLSGYFLFIIFLCIYTSIVNTVNDMQVMECSVSPLNCGTNKQTSLKC